MRKVVLAMLLLGSTAMAGSIEQAAELFEAGQHEAARKALSGLDADEPQVAYYLGRLEFAERRWKQALAHFETATETVPDNDLYWVWVGNTAGSWASEANMFRAAGLARKLRAAFDRAVEINPANLSARSSLIGFHLQAPGVVGGDEDEARRHLAAIREIDPRRGWIEQGRFHLMSDEPEQAAESYRQGLQAYPGDPAMSVGLAVLHHQQEDFAAAHQLLLPLSQVDEPDLNVLYQLGRTGALSGQFLDDSLVAMQRYITLAAEHQSPPVPLSAAWWRMGMIQEHQDQTEAARQSYQAALALDPDDENAQKALKASRAK